VTTNATTSANIVVIGAGIIGSSVAYHLAQMGIEGIVVVDKGDLDHNDGSTSHAPGGLRTLTGSHFFTKLGAASREVYDHLPLAIPGQEQFYRVGMLSIANTVERLDSHHRLAAVGLSHGIEANVLDPDEVSAMAPMVDPATVVGGISIPSSGIVRTSLLATSMRQVAEATGRAAFYGHSEVTDIEISNGRIISVAAVGEADTTACEQAIVCTNIWALLMAEKTQTPMPLFPGEHQYIFTDPVPALAPIASREVALPVTAFDDLSIYFRQHGDHLGIGSYAHEARLVDPAQLPKTAKLPFTPDDFTGAWEAMQHHMPALRRSGIADGFNGMFSFTVDNYPIMGQTRVAGLWSAVGAWLSFGSEVGAVMARWMTTGDPGMDVSPADANRFHRHHTNHRFLTRQAKYFYEIGFEDLHPSAVVSSVRNLRAAPYPHRLEALGAELIPLAGQETPLYYHANEPLVSKYEDQIPHRSGYDAIGWSPITGAEHLELRSNVGIVDWSAGISPLEVSGPGALDHLQFMCTANVDLPIGGIAYSLVLTLGGGVARDITVARIGEDTWWLLTGKANLHSELALYRSIAPDDGSVLYRDLSEEYVSIGLWGPNSRSVMEAATENNLSNETFPWYTHQSIGVGLAPVRALRISYVGELGWELYVPQSYALHVWDTLWVAGRAFDMPAIGVQAVMTARMEKGYRLWGPELSAEHTPAETGVAFAMDTAKDFRGKDAALSAPVGQILTTLTFDHSESVVYGWEPVLVDNEVIGHIAAGGFGFNVGAFIAHAFIDPDRIDLGAKVSVLATDRLLEATIAKGPLFDPRSERLRG